MKENDIMPLYFLSVCAGVISAVLSSSPFRLGITVLGLALPLAVLTGVLEDNAENGVLTGVFGFTAGLPVFAGIPLGTTVLLTATGMSIHAVAGGILAVASFPVSGGIAVGALYVPDLAKQIRLYS